MVVSLFAALYCTGILDKFVRHTINHVDKYYAFPSHFWLNTCSARDNYAHAQTVDTRLFFSPPTKSLGTRLGKLQRTRRSLNNVYKHLTYFPHTPNNHRVLTTPSSFQLVDTCNYIGDCTCASGILPLD